MKVSTVELTVVWPDPASAAAGILGTPFGPSFGSLAPQLRDAVHADLVARFAPASPGDLTRRPTTAVIARATAPEP